MKQINVFLKNNEVILEVDGYITIEKDEVVQCVIRNLKLGDEVYFKNKLLDSNIFSLTFNDFNDTMSVYIVIKNGDMMTKYKVKAVKTLNYKLIGELTESEVITKLIDRINVLEDAFVDLYEKKESERNVI